MGSAGNSATGADRNGFWVSAALRTDLTDIDGAPLQPVQQTLAVENLVDTGSPAYEPGCLATTSNRGGNLAAVGTNVFSLKLGTSAGNDSGTSQAAPQAAGLAEYMWKIAPDLTATQLKAAIVATAAASLGSGPPCGTDLPSAPRLDAYAAVLSLDETGAPTPAGSPVRLALLDRTGDGALTEADLQAWVDSLPAADAPARTWSRSDLNGDGFTGGTRAAPFDLARGTARGAAPQLNTTISQPIENTSVAFDETAATDMQIVCFYAYSSLYTGNPAQRKSVLDPEQRCGATSSVESENCTATTAFGRAATIMGTAGNDRIDGTSGPDVIVAGAGDDFIGGLEGDDRICGGTGEDRVSGGLATADSDDPDGAGPLPPINSGNDLLDGGPDNDRVHGTGGDDRVFGGDGRDSVLGGSPGSDFMEGGPGDGDVCSRAEIPRDGGAGGPDSFGTGCEFINNF